MATVQELQRHRQRCLRHGVAATVGGLLLAVVPLSELVVGAVGSPNAAVALSTITALAGLLGVVALHLRYRGGHGVVGRIGATLLVAGLVALAVGGATGSLDLLGQSRPGGGLVAVTSYFVILIGAVPFGFGLWQAGGSLGAAASFVLAMPVGYAFGLALQRFALPNVTAAFVGFGLPVAAGLVLAGVAVLLEPPPGCEE